MPKEFKSWLVSPVDDLIHPRSNLEVKMDALLRSADAPYNKFLCNMFFRVIPTSDGLRNWFNPRRMIDVLKCFISHGFDVRATYTPPHGYSETSILDIVCKGLSSRTDLDKEVVVCFVTLAKHDFGIQFKMELSKLCFSKINVKLNSMSESVKQYLSPEVHWWSRLPVLDFIEGCETANCHISSYLFNEFIMREVCSFMEADILSEE